MGTYGTKIKEAVAPGLDVQEGGNQKSYQHQWQRGRGFAAKREGQCNTSCKHRPIGRCIEACAPDRATVQLSAIEMRQRGDISWAECRMLAFDIAFTHRFDPLRLYHSLPQH